MLPGSAWIAIEAWWQALDHRTIVIAGGRHWTTLYTGQQHWTTVAGTGQHKVTFDWWWQALDNKLLQRSPHVARERLDRV